MSHEPHAWCYRSNVNDQRLEKPRVLLIEDDDQLAKLLDEYLTLQGFALHRESSGVDAESLIQKHAPELIILDLMLPGLNGLDVCRQIRGQFEGAILMLTASQSEADHVAGLELGADDFVIKPIEPRVLLARIRTLLRRIHGGQSSTQPAADDILQVGPLTIDVPSRDVQVEGQSVSLTTMEFDVILMLARQAGSVVSREDLYTKIIGIEYDGIDRGMDVHISRIRRKLQQLGFEPRRLKSIRSAGYLLTHR